MWKCDTGYGNQHANISNYCIRLSIIPKSPLLSIAALLVIYHLISAVIKLNSGEGSIPEKPGHRLRPDIDLVISSIKEETIDTLPFERKKLLPAFHRYTEKFEVSKKYKLSICSIPKIMSTFGTSLICFLKNPSKFKALGRKISTETWATSLCSKRYVHSNYTLSERELGSIRIAFVREPIDRFLSGFVNKCILPAFLQLWTKLINVVVFIIAGNLGLQLDLDEQFLYRKTAHETDSCYGCGSNLNCFVEEFRKQLWDVYTKNNPSYRFLITNTLAPQSWYCDFKEHIHDYVYIRYGNHSNGELEMVSQLHEVLKHAGIPPNLLTDIIESMLDGKSHHSTFFTDYRRMAANELYSNHTLLRMVTELYYYDFIIFDYPIPKI